MNLRPADVPPPIPILLLAAGGSTRLGHPKQLVPYRGSTLLRHAAETALAAGIGPVLVVLGAEAERCAVAIEGLPLGIVTHARWDAGLGTSIAAGVRACHERHPDLAGVLLMSCDQPLVDAAALRALAAAFRASGAPAVAAAYKGTVGIPAIFARSELTALESLAADHGAKGRLLALGLRLVRVACPAAALDVDTAADLGAIRSGPN